jgi:hypothetical protein
MMISGDRPDGHLERTSRAPQQGILVAPLSAAYPDRIEVADRTLYLDGMTCVHAVGTLLEVVYRFSDGRCTVQEIGTARRSL